ncbi:MAG: hypothetical protein HQL11_03020 [Candidatus Omnitrophica bacterium]|nr:hypothetical protein [Candidatus Omnitrophota bacterium]
MKRQLEFRIKPQPDDAACGPTCLQAVYDYYGDPMALRRVIREVPALKEGGTLAVLLACHALKRGYHAKIFTYNLQVFDPTWFTGGVDIAERLRRQIRAKRDAKLRFASRAYLEFLSLGGRVLLQDLTPALIRKYLNRSVPILTGLSSTFLYRAARETRSDDAPDDVRGEPTGHFVVVFGYDRRTKRVMIADPLKSNPFSRGQFYPVSMSRLIDAILLGVVTYDANLLIIETAATSL